MVEVLLVRGLEEIFDNNFKHSYRISVWLINFVIEHLIVFVLDEIIELITIKNISLVVDIISIVIKKIS